MTEAMGQENSAEGEQGYTSTVESIDEVTKKATVTIPVERVSREFESAVSRMQATARIKGFRPGKAPRHIVEKMHGARLRMDVANKLISETLQAIVKSIDETVVGNPEIDLSSFEPGEDISFTASLSLFPTPEISSYDDCKVEVVKREVTDKDIDKVLDSLMSSKATQKPIEDRKTAEAGDIIDALLTDVTSGEEGASEPLVIAIGEDLLPAELDNGIIGMSIGETRDISISHGAEAHCAEGEGEHVHTFRIVLNALSQKIMPELTDDFVKTLQFDGVETALELKKDIRERLEEEQKQTSDEDINSEVMKILLEKNEFLIPAVLVEDEIRSLVARAGKIDPQKVDAAEFDVDPFRATYGESAEKRVRMTIIVDRIAEKEDLKAKEDDIQQYLDEVAGKHNLPVEEVRKYFMDQSRAMGTFLEVTRNKVLKFLRDKATVSFTDPVETESK